MLRNGETGDWVGTFEGHKGAVWSACLNTPATHAATASADFSARVWDAIKGEEVFNFAHKHIVRTVAFSQVRCLALRSRARRDCVHRPWQSAPPLAALTLLPCALLRPLQDSKRLMTGGHEKLIRVFDLMAPDAEPAVLEGAPGPVRNGMWHAGDTLLLAAFNDVPGVRVWDVRSGKVVRTLETAEAVTDVCLSLGGKLLVTASGKQVRTWNADTFEPVATFTLAFPVESAAVAPAKGRFVAAGADMWPRLYDLATGAELECNKGHHGPVHSVRFHPSGDSYASGSEDGTIRIWSSTTAAEAAAAADGGASAA
jgi:serine-threonine kinase receptor-associated protein